MPSHWRYKKVNFVGYVTHGDEGEDTRVEWKYSISLQQLYTDRQTWNWKGDKENLLLAANLV